nr:MAG TPA: Protein kinase G rubredoxin domain [Caudoviricetes sp.]
MSYRKSLSYIARQIKNQNDSNAFKDMEELVERATPKQVKNRTAIMSYNKTHILNHTGYCPVCGKAVSHSAFVVKDGVFCDDCGQALDWGE